MRACARSQGDPRGRGLPSATGAPRETPETIASAGVVWGAAVPVGAGGRARRRGEVVHGEPAHFEWRCVAWAVAQSAAEAVASRVAGLSWVWDRL